MVTARNSLDKLTAGVSTRANLLTYFNSNLDIIDAALAKCNFAGGATAPDGDNDETEGYAIGSKWHTDTAIWECVDPSDGAAVWRQVWPVTAVGANVDFGAYEVRAATFQSDIGTGAAPLIVASTTLVTNLHAANSDALNTLADTAFLKHSLATAANDFLVASGVGEYVKKTLAETQAILAVPLKADLSAKGDIYAASAASTVSRLGIGANGTTLIADSAQTYGFSWAELMTDGVYRQLLINGEFQVNQRAVAAYTSATTPANSDDTYLLDQWCLLSDGNDIADVSPSATVIPTGGAAAIKFDVETINKKFGIIQFIESKDAIKYAGKVASLQFKARTVTDHAVENIRAAVLSWSSTADTLTSDVVSAWENEGTNPTLVANWTYENVAVNLVLVADTWTTYKIENISIDTASMANLAVFIWVDDTDCALEDLLYISQVQLNQGAVCLPYMPRSFEDDLQKCMRFWQKSNGYAVAPAEGADSNAGLCVVFDPGYFCLECIRFPVQMRGNTDSNITFYKPTGAATAGKWTVDGNGATFEQTPAAYRITSRGIDLYITCSARTPGTAARWTGGWVVSRVL